MSEFKSIFIEGTAKTPKIEFNTLTGELILQGRSFPENTEDLYEPLLDWVSEYARVPQNTTNLYLKLEYFNSSSLLWIIKMIKALCKIEKQSSTLYFHLYFDDDDFEIKDADELKDVICSIIDNIGDLKVTTGIKIHGADSNGKVVDESTILN